MKTPGWFRQQRLAKQLLLGFGFSLTTVGLTTLWINYRLIHHDLQNQVEERAQSVAQSLEFSAEGLLEQENDSILRRIVQNYATLPAVVEVAIVSPDGMTLARSSLDGTRKPDYYYRAMRPELAALMEEASRSGVGISQRTALGEKPVVAYVLPFRNAKFRATKQRALTVAIIDLNQVQQEASKTLIASTLTLLVGTLLILLFMAIVIHRNVLEPLRLLHLEVDRSKRTGTFALPVGIPANEIKFLATTFDDVIKQLEKHDQLRAEISQRLKVEAELREREAEARRKSIELEQTLQELRQAQIHLVQSEKMSSLGQLVAGVAHEINNPVNFIHGNIHYAHNYVEDLLELMQLYQQHYPNPDRAIQKKTEEVDLKFLQEDLRKLLSSMQIGTDRIRDIVRSLRAFSRLDEAEVKDVDIHEGLDSTLLILHNRLKGKGGTPGIQIVKEYGNLPRIECYAGQLNQVFMNILSNAIEALEEESHSGKWSANVASDNPLNYRTIQAITVQDSRLLTTDAPTIRIHTQVVENWLMVRIADNGPGMPESVKKRLFDPFFTTKAVGKGTGMGMSISHQVITERHRGRLTCFSEPGMGTEFVIEIPLKQAG